MDPDHKRRGPLPRLVVVGLAGLAALGTAAANIGSIMDLWERPAAPGGDVVAANPAPLVLKPTTSTIDPGPHLRARTRLYPGQPGSHLLVMRIEARFDDARFNTPAYLRSLDTVELSSAKARVVDVLIEEVPPTDQEPSKASWLAFVAFAEMPQATDRVRLDLGPRTFTVALGTLDWQGHETRLNDGGEQIKAFRRAEATLDIALTAPDWIVAQSARLLPYRGQGNDTAGTSGALVELIVENRTTSPVAFRTTHLAARHDRGFNCDTPEGDPAPVQTVTLDWSAILTAPTEDADSAANEGAWTRLQNFDVEAPVEYQPATCWHDFNLNVALPVQFDVPPGALRRLTLNLVDLGRLVSAPGGDVSVGGLNLRPPTAISQWQALSLSLEPAGGVFPKMIPVDRQD